MKILLFFLIHSLGPIALAFVLLLDSETAARLSTPVEGAGFGLACGMIWRLLWFFGQGLFYFPPERKKI